MGQFDFRVFRREGNHVIAPHLRDFEHITFIHRTQLLFPFHRRFKGNPPNPIDLRLGIGHGIDTALFTRFRRKDATRLSEIQTARQLTHYHDVSPFNDFPLESRSFNQLGQDGRWSQIGKEI